MREGSKNIPVRSVSELFLVAESSSSSAATDSGLDGMSDLLTVFLRLVAGTLESDGPEVLASAVESSCGRLFLGLFAVLVTAAGKGSLLVGWGPLLRSAP